MRRLLLTLLLGTALLCQAASKNPPARHQLRLGWGDMLFETLAFYPAKFYTGHFFAEYRYSFTKVTSVGIQSDLQGIFREGIRDYDLSLLPTVRFTFLDREWVQLYAGMGAGLLFAFDSARALELAPVVNTTLLGVQVGKGPWSGALELGGMSALRNAQKVYMLGSRLVSVSVNYRW